MKGLRPPLRIRKLASAIRYLMDDRMTGWTLDRGAVDAIWYMRHLQEKLIQQHFVRTGIPDA